MRYICEESLTNFDFWSGAKNRADLLTYSELEELDNQLENFFVEIPTATQINDLFWFNFDQVCQLLGTTEEELEERQKANEETEMD